MNPRQATIYYLEQRAFGRAEKLLREWVLANPDDVYAHMELIWCFYKRSSNYDRWGDCNQFFEQIYDRPNAQVIRHFVQAEQLLYEDREEESLVYYKVAIDGGLNVPAVHYSFGVAMEMLGRSTEAKAEYEIALDQDQGFLPALVDYGHILFKEGRFDRVEAMLQTLNGIEPRSLEYQFKDAIKDLKGLDRVGRACVALRRSIELLYEDKIRDAAMTLWPVFREQKNNCWFIRTMVYLFYRAGWLLWGRKRLKELLEEESAIFHYVTGLMFWYEDKCEDALRAYNTAFDKGLDHFLVYCARALVYEELKKNREQEEDLLAALSYAPWCIYPKENLVQLKYEQGKFNEVDNLAHVTFEENECAINYDISGRVSLADLQWFALSSLLNQGKATEALFRVNQDKVPYEDKDLHFQRAMVYIENQQYSAAALELTECVRLGLTGTGKANKERFQLIVEKESNCFGVAFLCALRPAFADDFNKAKDNLETLVRDFPNEPEAWYHLANVSFILEDSVRAKEACRKALALDSNHKNTLSLLCELLQKDADIPALRMLSKDLGGAIEPLEFAFRYAEENKQIRVAEQIASELLKIDPTNIDAALYLLKKLTPRSLEYAKMAEHLATSIPLDFETRTLVANIMLMNGVAEEALERYDRLFADGLDSVHNVLMQGLAYLALKPSEG